MNFLLFFSTIYLCNVFDSARSNATIYLNVQTWVVFPQLPDFFHHIHHEFLSTKSRFDRHDQHHVGLGDIVLYD